MKRTFIADVKPGEQVKIAGFVENCRNKKARAFLVIRDMTGKVQVYVEKEGNEALAAVVDQLTIDSVVTIEGECIANEYVKMGGMEIIPTSIRIESIADALPIKEDSAIDSRLDYRWVDLRTERNTLIFHVQSEITAAMRDYNDTGLVRATIVGTTTYKKGVIQNTYYYPFDMSTVTLTVAYYKPPCGVNFDGVGISPDVYVEYDGGETDNQLETGIEELLLLINAN